MRGLRPKAAARRLLAACTPRAGRLRRAALTAPLALVVLAGASIALARSIAKGRPRPPAVAQCIANHLNASALLRGTSLSVSPLPGARDASPHTQISLLGVPAEEIKDVSVTGSYSGGHEGHLRAYSQGDGGSFVPSGAFAPGETVHVSGRLADGAASRRFAFEFTVAVPDPIAAPPTSSKPRLGAGDYQSFHSAPVLHPPALAVTHPARSSDSREDIFTAPYSGPGNDGPMIFAANGQLVWMDPLPENVEAANLQVQSYEGRPVLTWWQGGIPQNGFGMGEEIVADSSYKPIMRVQAGNGYRADLHDFRLEPNGTALLTVFSPMRCDLSSIEGPRAGDLNDSGFQEVDLRTGLVRREWMAADHIALAASYASGAKASAEWPYDYAHINTIDPQPDGTTLLSARNTSQLYLIDDTSGQITSTVGGKHSSVAVQAGAATAYQHDASTLGASEISVFDNGGSPFEHPQSRAIVLRLDGHAVAKVAELDHSPAIRTPSQGSVQQLPDGDWFVGWGQEPYFTQYDAAGHMVFDAHMPAYTNSYRAYRFEWSGTPSDAPALAAQRTSGGLTVYASWNGATNVASWRVLGGDSRESLTPLAESPSSGFETAIGTRAASYVEVQALDSRGTVLASSPAVAATG
jgi:Arylsulfotransferase (ASST)